MSQVHQSTCRAESRSDASGLSSGTRFGVRSTRESSSTGCWTPRPIVFQPNKSDRTENNAKRRIEFENRDETQRARDARPSEDTTVAVFNCDDSLNRRAKFYSKRTNPCYNACDSPDELLWFFFLFVQWSLILELVCIFYAVYTVCILVIYEDGVTLSFD